MTTRIKLDNTTQEILLLLAEGNPGALTVLTKILLTADGIDPDNFLGPFGVLLHLDSNNIYGPSIWMLFKDVCKQDITTMMAVLRCDQLGIRHLKESELHNREKSEELRAFAETAVALVRERLPRFAANNDQT